MTRSRTLVSNPIVFLSVAVALSLYAVVPGRGENDLDTKPAKEPPPVSGVAGPSSSATTKDGLRPLAPNVAARKTPIHPKPAPKGETIPKSTLKADGAPAPVINPQPAAPQSSGEPTGEFEPVLHARNAQITTCMDKIVALSGRVIDRPHKAVSSWVQAAPNDHVFQSIIGMTYPNKAAPNGAAIVLAAPVGASKCDGETVQIYPTTSSCTAVQATLVKNGRTLTTLQSLPLLETTDGNRNLLMPTAGGGCVVVSIGLR